MALPSSGPISMAMVAAEIGISASGLSLNDSRVRQLAGRPSGAISFADLHGKSWIIAPTLWLSSVDGSGQSGGRWYIGMFNAYFNFGRGGSPSTLSATIYSGSNWAWIGGVSGNRVDVRNSNYSGRPQTSYMRVTATNARGSASLTYRLEMADLQGGSCFTGDSLVLMANGTQKRIDQIVPGDLVATAFGVSEVDWIRHPLLENRPLLAMEGGRCKTSAEHMLWTPQGWATRDMEQFLKEANTNTGPGLNGQVPQDYTNKDHGTFATIDGWETTHWERVDASPDTKLYHLYLKDHASYFVDGFLVMGELPRFESQIDWTQFQWNPSNRVKPVYHVYGYDLPAIDPDKYQRH